MATRIETLASILRKAPGSVFIQPHDVPDPDAIASAFGLRQLLARRGVEATIVYGREYQKIDTRRMVELLGIELSRAADVASIDSEAWLVLVDGQKGNANIGDLHCREVASIDHHELRSDASYLYSDIRPELGSCSAMIAEYYFEAGETPPVSVATALTYGIFVDTDNLTRGVSDLDARMFHLLHAHVDPELIVQLRGSQLVLRDLAIYAEAFKTVDVYGRLGFLRLADADDSLIGAATDILLSLDEVDVALAFSSRLDGIKLSVRSHDKTLRADDLARGVVEGLGYGGGHAHMAGGFIPAAQIPPDKPVDLFIKHRAICHIERLADLPAP